MTAVASTDDPAGEEAPTRARGRLPLLVGAGSWLAIVVPLVVAVLAVRSPQWHPVADLAQYELRVRDVGGSDTPLIGLVGRIGDWWDPGSHPGPLSFWLLAPVYRLLGSSSAAFVASSVVLHAAALGLVLWLAARRLGLFGVAITGAALAVLTRFYGHSVFVEPWNPYLPVSWWLVLLFAMWSVLDDDLVALPVAVVAGTMCAQTHLPYLGLVGGLGAVTALALVLAWWSARGGSDPAKSRRVLAWSAGSVVLALLLWLPPIIDQIWRTGNLGRIVESLREPGEDPVGLQRGIGVLLRCFDPSAFVGGRDLTGVSDADDVAWGALLLLGLWVGAVILARLWGHSSLLRLHVVIASAMVLAVFSASRVHGELWHYLFLWSWGLAAVTSLSVVWTAGVAVLRWRPELARRDRPGSSALVAALSGLVVLAASVSFAVDNRDAEPARPDLSADLGVVTDQTVEALGGSVAGASGRSGRYLVRWTDRVTIGSQGFGLVNELAREGFDVGVIPAFGSGAGGSHRVLQDSDATLAVQLVVGPDIAEWEDRPDATRVVFVDSRTPEQSRRYDELMDRIDDDLRGRGLDRLADDWSTNLFTTWIDADVPADVHALMSEVLAMTAPVAVFLVPPS